MKTKDIKNLISQVEGEPDNFFRLFVEYAMLSPIDRINGKKDLAVAHGVPEKELAEAVGKYNWEKRLNEIDTALFVESFETRAKTYDDIQIETKRKIAESRNALLDSIVQPALALSAKVLNEALIANKPIQSGWVKTEDGREVPTYTEYVVNTKVSDVTSLVNSIQRVIKDAESISSDIAPPEKIAEEPETVLPAKTRNLEKLSDEELEQYVN